MAELDKPHPSLVDRTIEDLSAERNEGDPSPPLVGSVRAALDFAFRHDSVERIVADLEALTQAADDAKVKNWASETLATLQTRSPTSLKVALEAIRRGKQMSLGHALNMELKIATAFCVCFCFMTASVLILTLLPNHPAWCKSRLRDGR